MVGARFGMIFTCSRDLPIMRGWFLVISTPCLTQRRSGEVLVSTRAKLRSFEIALETAI
ncbi:hypothetical protein LINPERHAP1_LOCUS8828 [Linum perenne]